MSQSVARATSPLSVILDSPERLKELPIETLERLYELHERDRARAAEREFTAAFVAVQSELQPVARRCWTT